MKYIEHLHTETDKNNHNSWEYYFKIYSKSSFHISKPNIENNASKIIRLLHMRLQSAY